MIKSWHEMNKLLSTVVGKQMFFIGGAPRSGTTWLQQILDSHPQTSCKGEGLFGRHLYQRLEEVMGERTKSLQEKNQTLFKHTGGYPIPRTDDFEFLAATAILLAFSQQMESKNNDGIQAVGEKTPENVFIFGSLRAMFPDARFIGVARDPRDVLTSAWYFFRKPTAEVDDHPEMVAFFRHALPSIAAGMRAMMTFEAEQPASYRMVTYEGLRRNPETVIADLFEFLGVSHDPETVRACLSDTSFSKVTGGREAGMGQNGAFLRKGVVGDWRTTLTPEMNDLILRELGWMFPYFGWIS